jgi:hypothetical protein
MKGKSWGKLPGSASEGYNRVSAESGRPKGKPSGKFVAVGRSKEYATNVVGSHGGKPSGKFLGQTGQNSRHGSKLMPERTSGVSTGHGGGQHKAGG